MGNPNAGSADKRHDPAFFEIDGDEDAANPCDVPELDSTNERYLDSAALRLMMSRVLGEPVPEE